MNDLEKRVLDLANDAYRIYRTMHVRRRNPELCGCEVCQDALEQACRLWEQGHEALSDKEKQLSLWPASIRQEN